MRIALVVCVLALPALLGGCSASGGIELTSTEDAMIARHNDARAAAGLQPLAVSTTLNEIAQQHANHMAKILAVKHEDSQGNSVAERAQAAGYNYVAIGENIGSNLSPTKMFNAWMDSPGHRENIESAAYTEMGVGVATVFTQQYWCVVFGDR